MRVAAYAVIERRGEVLLTHWRRGHMHGWTLPGGGIEEGEDPRDAVVREVAEETGLEAKVGKLLGVDSRVMVREDVGDGEDPRLHTIRIIYRARAVDGPLINEVDGSSDEARWVKISELKNMRTLSLVETGLKFAGVIGSQRSRRRKRSALAGKPHLKHGARQCAKYAHKQNGGKQNGAKQNSAKQNSKANGGKQGAKQAQKHTVKNGAKAAHGSAGKAAAKHSVRNSK